MQEENEFTFRSTDMAENCFSFFADIKKQEKFCDITLTVGVERISAHRIILAAAIPFFRDMLSAEQQEIEMPDINANIFQCLINFAYSCELKINMENVSDLLSAACLLCMEEVRDACCDFLAHNLRPQNVLNFKELTDDVNYPPLVEIIDECIKENFMEITGTEKFLELPFNCMKQIIGKDDLHVDSEEKVLDAVMFWVKASPSERKENLLELLREVRMPLLTPLYLTDLVEREELIRLSIPIRDLIDEARNYNILPERRKDICSFSTEPRQLIKISSINEEKQCIYILSKNFTFRVHRFSDSMHKWVNRGKYIYSLDVSAAVLKQETYFFYGGNTWAYDPELDEFTRCADCVTPRSLTAATSLKNGIYVCGGNVGGSVALNVVECYDAEDDEWSKVSSLHTARWALQAVTLGEHIYALGGRDSNCSYNTVERYPSVTGKWAVMPSMLTQRHSFGATVLNGKIYVSGGCTNLESESTATAEVYDPIRKTWEMISPMSKARNGFFLVPFQGKLYAIDGCDDNEERLPTCEVYNPENDRWTLGLSTDVTLGISAAFAI